jgi:small subunit ribosomal protein S1
MSNIENPTMGTLLGTITDPAQLTIGNKVKGTIVTIAKNQVILSLPNIGLGMVRGKELYNEEYISKLKIGEEIESVILDLDNEQGYVELSFRAIGRDKIWQEITASFENKETISAKIRDANRGGFLIKVNGIDGFLPASLLSPAHAIKATGLEEKSLANKMKKYIGQSFNVKLVNISPETDSVIVSEKAVSDEASQYKLAKYKIGDTVEGNIIGIVEFGLFIRFDDDLEGLCHISEISWKKVENPNKEYRVGEKVTAKITDIDKDNRINLSMKQTQTDPWVAFSKGIKPGDIFKAKISKITTFGAIAVNDENIQGLCHISQISETPIETPAKIHEHLRPGNIYDFTILSIGNDQRLFLTMLPLERALQIQSENSQKTEQRIEDKAQKTAKAKEESSEGENE